MNAIIVTGGKQYKVSEGDVIYIEKLDNEAGDTVKFEQVLAIIDGEKATFGTPVVEGASVEAKIVKNGKGKKVRIFKYNPSSSAESASRSVRFFSSRTISSVTEPRLPSASRRHSSRPLSGGASPASPAGRSFSSTHRERSVCKTTEGFSAQNRKAA